MRKNWEGPSSEAKTLIITGVEPGDGVAIMANAIRRLGVPVFFFPAGAALRPTGGGMTGDFAEIARNLTAQHTVWGARVPFRNPMLGAAKRTAVNPYYIIVMEDAASIAISVERNTEGGETDALAEAAKRNAELAFFAAEVRKPAMVISLQKAREFASTHIDAIAAFAGIEPTPERRLAAIALIDQGARSLRTTTSAVGIRVVQGALDSVQKGGQIRGWAKQPLSDERVLVRVLVDGVEVAEAIADQFRDDLLRNRIGDGRHGFVIPIAQALSRQPAIVEVNAAADNSPIGTAEMTIAGGRATG
jgi:hypothetical protein